MNCPDCKSTMKGDTCPSCGYSTRKGGKAPAKTGRFAPAEKGSGKVPPQFQKKKKG